MAYGFFSWFFGIVLGFIAGGIFVAALYLTWTKIRNFFLKRKMPKDPKVLLNPGNPEKLNQQEVKDNDRKQSAKFREYEKLRRTGVTNSKGGERQAAGFPSAPTADSGTTPSLSKRTILQNEPDSSTSGIDRNSKKGIQLIEPTDISDK